MYVADYKAHTIFVFGPGATPRVYFQSDRFNQPERHGVRARRARSMRAIRTGAAATGRCGALCRPAKPCAAT
jgi:hypothetical protein